MDSENSGQDVVRCDICERDYPRPTLHCEMCLMYFCEACVGNHISDAPKEHPVVPFRQRRTTLIYPKCSTHCKLTCELHCEQCDTPVCSICVTKNHNKQPLLSYIKIVEKQRKI